MQYKRLILFLFVVLSVAGKFAVQEANLQSSRAWSDADCQAVNGQDADCQVCPDGSIINIWHQCPTSTPTPATQPPTSTVTATVSPTVVTGTPVPFTPTPVSQTPPAVTVSPTASATAPATATKKPRATETPENHNPPVSGVCEITGSDLWDRNSSYTLWGNPIVSWDSMKQIFVVSPFKFADWPEGSKLNIEKNGQFYVILTVTRTEDGIYECIPNAVVETLTPTPPVFVDTTNYSRQVTDESDFDYGFDCSSAWVQFSNATLLGAEVNGKPVEFSNDGSRGEIQLNPGIYNIVFRFLGLRVPLVATIEPCVSVQTFAFRARIFNRGDYQLLDAATSGLDQERNDPLIDTLGVEIESIVFVKDGAEVVPSMLELRGQCAFYDFKDRTGDFWVIVNKTWYIEVPEGYMSAPVSSCYLNEDGTLHLVPGVYPVGIWLSLGGDIHEFYVPDESGKMPLYYWRQIHPVTPHTSNVQIPEAWKKLLGLK